MEERKLSVDINKKDMSTHIQKIEQDASFDLRLASKDASRIMDNENDNWSELRF